MWRLWAKALGQKEGRDEKEADKIAIIRSLIMLQLVLTNMFIISGNILSFYKHFNDVPTERLPLQHQSIQKKYSR